QREVRLYHVGAGPYPIFVVSATQLIQVDQNIPVRWHSAVALECGASPQTPRMVGVAPKVVEMVAAPHDIGNPGVGVHHLECLLAESLESIPAQFGEGRVVVLAHP